MRTVTLLAAAILAGMLMIAAAVAMVILSVPAARAATCQTLVASWYGAESGNITANGERFDGSGLTAAHRSWRFGTILDVTYRGKTVRVRVNDRGPYVGGRQLDLSHAAARRIGLLSAGVGQVQVCRIRSPP